jgi:hypothetical protein
LRRSEYRNLPAIQTAFRWIILIDVFEASYPRASPSPSLLHFAH